MPQYLSHIRQKPSNKAAVVFIHGFGGDASATWQNFPKYLAAEGRLAGWDIYTLGYETHLRIDFLVKLWSADPDLDKVAKRLRTEAKAGDLKKYDSLCLIAHSMGGLVTQRALVDDKALRTRTSHVFLFGTPSGGLAKASLVRLLKPQLRNMSKGGKFIRDLRADWDSRFASAGGVTLPFRFVAVAGESDEFVPAESSLGPFPEAEYPDTHCVVPGDHLQMVKPSDAKSLSVQVVVKGLTGAAPAAGPLNAAMVANQFSKFKEAVELLEPMADKLDDVGLVQLALALEGVGRQKDAIAALGRRKSAGTDVLGVLGGRLKRRWLLSRIAEDGDGAQALYEQGFAEATKRGDHAQAYYHGINVAFMRLAKDNDVKGAKAAANVVLDECKLAAGSELNVDKKWRYATEGEAMLLLGRVEDALKLYALAASPDQGASTRELDSMYRQAIYVSRLVAEADTVKRLGEIFEASGP